MRASRLPLLFVVAACHEPARSPRALAPDTVYAVADQVWGTLDGPPETVFAEIRSLAAGSRGQLFVHDAGRGIIELAPNGAFVRIFAAPGQGPLEVRSAYALHARGILVAAWDAGNKRISVWREDGTLLGSAPAPRFWTAYDESALTLTAEGDLWAKIVPDARDDGMGFPRPEYIRIWPGGQPDTIWVEAGGPACDHPYDFSFRRGFWLDRREPWFPSHLSALGEDGALYVGCTDDFSFTRYADGDSLRFSRPNRRIPILDDEREFFESVVTPPIGPLPDRRPEYSRIIPSTDGKVWVFETAPPDPLTGRSGEMAREMGYANPVKIGETQGHFSVFSSQGDLIAIVPLPEGMRYSGYPTTPSVLIRGDTLWTVTTGEFDEQYVTRFIVPIPESGERR